MKWLGIIATVILFAACFMNWVTIESKQIVITGVETEGTRFGRPGYFHFLFGLVFLLLSMVPRIGAKRINVLIAAVNMAWAIRNFLVISTCAAGECPTKETGLYLVLFSSIIMMLASLFPGIKLPTTQKTQE